MNNRLDFISEFEAPNIAMREMSDFRAAIMFLDEELRSMIDRPVDAALARAVSLARTHLESALAYGIKSLCLKHEKKVTENV